MSKDKGKGLRYDSGKPAMHLLPPFAMLELGKLFARGVIKYYERNWEKGMKWSKMLSPMLRHVFRFMLGQNYDKETGVHHLACVAWNALCLLEFTQTHPELDDRSPYSAKIELDDDYNVVNKNKKN